MNHRGFTLVELMLAMGLFSVILTVSTVGFIGINRTYTHASIKKQLAESIQRLNTDVTDAVRNPQAETVKTCTPNLLSPDAGCPAINYYSVCLTAVRYTWGLNGGLQKDSPVSCDSATIADPINIVSDRFIIADFRVTYVGNHLFQAKGVIRTADSGAFTVTDNEGSINPGQSGWDVLTSPYKIKCKGSSAGVIVQTCAVQSFDFIINSRSNVI